VRITLIDSRDSFVHNLSQALQVLGATVRTVQSTEIHPLRVLDDAPDRLVIGPGPGHPDTAGHIVDVVRHAAGKVPLLGVCLGHQAIALAFGGGVMRHNRAVHGVAEPVRHDGRGLFRDLPPGVEMTRYHSLVVDPDAVPAALHVCAWSDDGAIMGLRHRTLPVCGVQFHPESVLSGAPGLRLLRQFVSSGCEVHGRSG
jgi:anthranilate synthase/aminodeoxychorismate synthase-like glutamine amidotransferase